MLRALRRNDQIVKIVLNMVGVAKRPEIPVKDFGEALGLEPILVLPYEPAVFGAATNNGQMICEAARQSRSAQGLEFLACVMTGRQPEPKPKKAILPLPNFLKKP
jgi:pilus assembly protein CpaE